MQRHFKKTVEYQEYFYFIVAVEVSTPIKVVKSTIASLFIFRLIKRFETPSGQMTQRDVVLLFSKANSPQKGPFVRSQ